MTASICCPSTTTCCGGCNRCDPINPFPSGSAPSTVLCVTIQNNSSCPVMAYVQTSNCCPKQTTVCAGASGVLGPFSCTTLLQLVLYSGGNLLYAVQFTNAGVSATVTVPASGPVTIAYSSTPCM